MQRRSDPPPASPRDVAPHYTLRTNARAKRITLRVLPGQGLVVSAPPRVTRREIAAVVHEHRAWAWQALAEGEAALPAACREWPPRQLDLAALGCRVVVGFLPSGQVRNVAAAQAGTLLELDTDPGDRIAVASAVAAWLKPRARRHLVPRLAALAERHGFAYRRCAIRGQRTVWGSYSASGTLSLNYKLLFLPPELVDYVLMHELVHTRHLDHSARFWDLLERCQPGARARDRRLHSAARRVPPWLERAH